MWQRIIYDILKMFCKDIDSKPSNDEIMKKLCDIERQIEHQENMALYRFRVGLGISFIGLGLGVKVATDNLDWLVIVLTIGGILVMFSADFQYREDINKRTAGWGMLSSIVGLAMSTIYLYCERGIPPIVLIFGVVLLIVGLFISVIASRTRKKSNIRKP